MILKGKKILIGVTGSIAAYKAATLIRLLKKQGAEVKVIMTASASHFITPLTLSTLSQNPVLSEFVKDDTGVWNSHVDLGLWADVILVAPASANTLAKMANGIADNLLIAVYLSARCPVFFAPAMDLDMYTHKTTLRNISILCNDGNIMIDAEEGELASGLSGKGRMAEPEHIVDALSAFFQRKEVLKGKKVLITAGPTKEYIDPVRYLTNASTGKMGYALAKAASDFGAQVTLISGPVHLPIPDGNVEVIKVDTSKEMYDATMKNFSKSNIAIFTAAVADYTPKVVSDTKIKKNDSEMKISLIKTHDIAKEAGKVKREGQLTVGFALETDNEVVNAQQKLKKKNFDFIVLNSLKHYGAGFGHDTNKITIIDEHTQQEFSLKSKSEVAVDILSKIIEKIK
ncbi:bifunctional phosphopantothenoylcysteine decarboxylase/phosphopantothenate--cysteine ligase CoaBC [Chondrinema litorale]|uniref:bifunctional phosphopantothenoylcysteine decarboxylase/phosphopantothenate--cysteine ligase CoaBC n=1 Tax=Chondrinema litorale TaxID=2994555 RepID=UPI00254473D6|nr:bifunctional phosphopantothenoylcysteine decarboxylase/phosphopantothenate--cysteine ligase CoaBC [Chondrinema litorale]UZR94466.1 bifunctional phosphopantothenoylcysteine decarboxylase/phosphopantothenate--cysteine ligase CoaBC [Chondrinema litorale]